MPAERSIIKKILILIKDLGENQSRLTHIEFVKDENGRVTGYKFEIKAVKEKKPCLKIIPGQKASTPS